jgi:hypothetical protein
MDPRIAEQHIEWFRKHEPFLFRVAQHIHSLNTKQLGFDWGGMVTSIATTVEKVAPVVGQVYTQAKVIDLQLARLKAGLPPLETSQLSPTVKVEASMSPEAEAAAKNIAIDVTRQGVLDFTSQMKPIFFGALALGAFFLLSKRSK